MFKNFSNPISNLFAENRYHSAAHSRQRWTDHGKESPSIAPVSSAVKSCFRRKNKEVRASGRGPLLGSSISSSGESAPFSSLSQTGTVVTSPAMPTATPPMKTHILLILPPLRAINHGKLDQPTSHSDWGTGYSFQFSLMASRTAIATGIQVVGFMVPPYVSATRDAPPFGAMCQTVRL